MTGRHDRGTGPRIGLDNYGLLPLGLTPMQTLGWAVAHGADGVAFSGLPPADEAALDAAALADLAGFARDHGLYLEWGGARHIPRDMSTWKPEDTAAANARAAACAASLGARVVRSCSGGLMRWHADAPPTETLLAETAASLRAQRSMLRDHGVSLAIETHFEFTSHELVRLLERCEAEPGDWLGICLDTMNLLTMLEDPLAATRRLLPWVISTHVKDGGVLVDEKGLTTFTAPVGAGVIDLGGIVSLLEALPREVHLSVEDHGGAFFLPIHDPLFLSRFPDLTAGELASLVRMACRTDHREECRPLPREAWPSVCEARIGADLAALRRIVLGRARLSEAEG